MRAGKNHAGLNAGLELSGAERRADWICGRAGGERAAPPGVPALMFLGRFFCGRAGEDRSAPPGVPAREKWGWGFGWKSSQGLKRQAGNPVRG